MFSYLYHNEGNGKFKDVSKAAGLHINNQNTPVAEGKALGVSVIDFNPDGWLDLIVANDTVRNYLFVNKQNGTFREEGIPWASPLIATAKPPGPWASMPPVSAMEMY